MVRNGPSTSINLDLTKCMLLFLTHTSVASAYVLFEAGYAYARGTPVVPIGLLGYDIKDAPPPIARLQGINVRSAEDLNDLVALLAQRFQIRFPRAITALYFERIISKAVSHGTLIRAHRLSNRATTYEDAIALIEGADDDTHVRATVAVFDPDDFDDPHFTRYLHTLAARCGEAAKHGGRFTYHGVFGFRRTKAGDMPARVRRSFEKRIAVFHAAGALKRVRFFEVPEQWALNMLFINNDHAIIGFPEDAEDSKLQYGVRLSGTDVVSPVVNWYDKCVEGQAWPLAIPSLRRGRRHQRRHA